MLTVIMTNWPEGEPGIMLADVDERVIPDEATARVAIEAALCESARRHFGEDGDPDVGEVIDLLACDDDILAGYGIRALGERFMAVWLDGYDHPLTDF